MRKLKKSIKIEKYLTISKLLYGFSIFNIPFLLVSPSTLYSLCDIPWQLHLIYCCSDIIQYNDIILDFKIYRFSAQFFLIYRIYYFFIYVALIVFPVYTPLSPKKEENYIYIFIVHYLLSRNIM